MHSSSAARVDSKSNSYATESRAGVKSEAVPLLILLGGLAARLFEAWRYFLNPDEALHYLLASQNSLSLTYKAALTNAHPPLLILLIHYWRGFGQSELMLRMPSVLAGTACCWLMYLWLRQIVGRSTAMVGLLLLALSPTMIGLSAELRQYALLLFFISACLYCSERAMQQRSVVWMALFTASLYGALLVHYSSLMFAAAIGVYMLARLYPYKRNVPLSLTWALGQIGGIAIAAYYVFTHILPLSRTNMLQAEYETYLRKSVFHSGQSNLVVFAFTQTLRVFTFIVSHGFVGTLLFIAFVVGFIFLFRSQVSLSKEGPTSRHLGLLLVLPFFLNYVAALAGKYPYGGTRHAAFLAVFGISAASIGLGIWNPKRVWAKPLVIALTLIFCNIFPAPPPLIRPRNQDRKLMQRAISTLRQSAQPGATIVAAYQSGLLLGYYACGHGIVQVFPPLHDFAESECGGYRVITTIPSKWKFYADDLPRDVAAMAKTYNLAPGSKLWLFDAGWITDSAPVIIHDSRVGCSSTRTFGENIFICELTVEAERPMQLESAP